MYYTRTHTHVYLLCKCYIYNGIISMYTVHTTLYSVQCTLYTIYYENYKIIITCLCTAHVNKLAHLYTHTHTLTHGTISS